MSLLSVLGGLAKSGVVRGFVGKVLGGASKSKKVKQLALPGMGAAAGAGLPSVIGRTVKRSLPGVVGGAAVGMGLEALTSGGQQPRKKTRRMNPCNDKALRRALRRIEAYDRQRKRVEKSLRKACPPSRRRSYTPRNKTC